MTVRKSLKREEEYRVRDTDGPRTEAGPHSGDFDSCSNERCIAVRESLRRALAEADAPPEPGIDVDDVIGALRLIEPNEPGHPGPYYDGWHAALDAVAARLSADGDSSGGAR